MFEAKTYDVIEYCGVPIPSQKSMSLRVDLKSKVLTAVFTTRRAIEPSWT